MVRWGSYDDDAAPQHVHAAGELKLTRLLGQKLHGRGLEGRQLAPDVEVGQQQLLRAAAFLVAVEVELHRLAFSHLNHIGRVAAFHGNVDLLHARAGGNGIGNLVRSVKEKPDDVGNEAQAKGGDEKLGSIHEVGI